MSKARLVITAVVLEGRSQSEVAREYGVSQPWISRLVARYRTEGEAAFEPRRRTPKQSPRSTSPAIVREVVEMRRDLERRGYRALVQVRQLDGLMTHSLTQRLRCSSFIPDRQYGSDSRFRLAWRNSMSPPFQ